MNAGQTPSRMTVDGELFEVAANPEHSGQYDFAWLSGPNEGYGSAKRGPTVACPVVTSMQETVMPVSPVSTRRHRKG